MFANLLFILTALAYTALAVMNFQKASPRGEYNMITGFVQFGIIAIYVITSMLLTISVASRGGF